MGRAMSDELRALLNDVVARRAPDLIPTLSEVEKASHDIRVRVAMILTEELAASALKYDSTPNARGLRIEELIDALTPWCEKPRK